MDILKINKLFKIGSFISLLAIFLLLILSIFFYTKYLYLYIILYIAITIIIYFLYKTLHKKINYKYNILYKKIITLLHKININNKDALHLISLLVSDYHQSQYIYKDEVHCVNNIYGKHSIDIQISCKEKPEVTLIFYSKEKAVLFFQQIKLFNNKAVYLNSAYCKDAYIDNYYKRINIIKISDI